MFLKVFNEMQGLSTIPHLADFERRLIKEESLMHSKLLLKRLMGQNGKKSAMSLIGSKMISKKRHLKSIL